MLSFQDQSRDVFYDVSTCFHFEQVLSEKRYLSLSFVSFFLIPKFGCSVRTEKCIFDMFNTKGGNLENV